MSSETWMINPSGKPDFLRLLCENAMMIHSCCLVGDPAPIVRERGERIHNPIPGDLVLETSWRIERYPLTHYVGRFLCTRDEIVRETEEPANDDDPEAVVDTYWYIERLDGSLCRWNNCQFIVIVEAFHASKLWADDIKRNEEGRADWVRAARQRHGL